jgi:hypothetical protein
MGVLIVGFIMGTIGFSYFIYGKKSVDLNFMLVGIALMVYPYFVQNIMVSTILGIILAACPFIIMKYF